MRILYVSPYPPQRDGIGDYTAALADATRAEGHDVAVVVPRSSAGKPVEVIGDLADLARTVERVRALDPDVVHVQFAVAAFGTKVPNLLLFLRALRPLRARVVITAHEVTRDTALLRAPGRALYRTLVRLADVVLVHTAPAHSALTGRLGASFPSVLVVPHHRRPPPPATTDAFALRARHGIGEAPVLLAFGFIHADKGLTDLVAALGRLERGAAHLVVAGGVRRRTGAFRAFELADRLHLSGVGRQVDRLGLRSYVHLTGYVPDGEVAPWFDAADAAVLPYRRIEQSGVGSLAAALGVPVLASTAGTLTEEYGDPRWSFPPEDPDRLAAVLDDFLRAPPAKSAGIGPRVAGGADIAAIAAATLAAYGPTPGRTIRGRAPVHHA